MNHNRVQIYVYTICDVVYSTQTKKFAFKTRTLTKEDYFNTWTKHITAQTMTPWTNKKKRESVCICNILPIISMMIIPIIITVIIIIIIAYRSHFSLFTLITCFFFLVCVCVNDLFSIFPSITCVCAHFFLFGPTKRWFYWISNTKKMWEQNRRRYHRRCERSQQAWTRLYRWTIKGQLLNVYCNMTTDWYIS